MDDYIEAQTSLQKFHQGFPDWYPNIVNFRLSYLADKIAEATAALPSTNAAPPTAAVPAPPGAPAAATTQLEAQLNALRGQVNQLRTGNELLQDKLKEALAEQPATVSPREFAQVQEQLRSLMKQNDLLKVSLAQGQGGAAGVNTNTVEQLKQALAGANQKLAVQTARADKLTLENQALQTRLQSLLAARRTARPCARKMNCSRNRWPDSSPPRQWWRRTPTPIRNWPWTKRRLRPCSRRRQ